MSFARAKTVLTHATGEVELQVPHDGEGTVEPVCRCRLNTDSEDVGEARSGRPDSNTD